MISLLYSTNKMWAIVCLNNTWDAVSWKVAFGPFHYRGRKCIRKLVHLNLVGEMAHSYQIIFFLKGEKVRLTMSHARVGMGNDSMGSFGAVVP